MANKIYSRGLKLSFIREPHFNKKGLAGRIKRKNISAGCNRRLKVPLYYQKTVVSAIIGVILMMSRAAQTHLAGRVFETPDLQST